MNILFLDLSSKSTGWCLSSEKGEMLKWGLIPISGDNTLERIKQMTDKIVDLIKENSVGKIVAEDVHPEAYGNKSHTERVLMWLQGSVALGAHSIDTNIDYDFIEFINSSSWRKLLGMKLGPKVKRVALKQADIEFVKNKYGIVANDDVCDAICLYTAYFTKPQEEYNWE